MTYDPRAHGARCDKCLLSQKRVGLPVPPELNLGAEFLAVGEAPGHDEVEFNKPFIGQSGAEAMTAFQVHGLERRNVSWSNACLCRPPDNRMDRIDEESKKIAHKFPNSILYPWMACRPRLMEELKAHSNVLALGTQAVRSILNDGTAGIMKLRGFPAQIEYFDPDYQHPDGITVYVGDGPASPGAHKIAMLPVFHPSFLARQRRWTKVFRGDVARAIRLFRNQDLWVKPNGQFIPPPSVVREFLLGPMRKFYVHDVETDSKYALKAKLRCIGFSDTQTGIVIPFLSIDGFSTFYTEAEMQEIMEILRAFYTDRTRIKAGWNSGYYDRIVIKREIGVTPVPEIDGILVHRAVDSELPHNLGFVASCWTEVPRAWKKDHTATDPKSDMALWEYNLLDNILTARCIEPLWSAADIRQQIPIVTLDHKIQSYCVGMHENGLAVDPNRRAVRDRQNLEGEPVTDPKKRAKLLNEKGELKDNLHYVLEPDGTVKKKGLLHYKTSLQMLAAGVVGKKGVFNPGSNHQVQKVIYEAWGLPAEEFTKKGAPATGDGVLLKFMADLTDKTGHIRRMNRYQFLDALRWYRRLSKERGTYILKFKREDEFIDPTDAFDTNEDEDDEEDRYIKPPRMGKVGLDGRIHCGWNAHTVATRRLSSSDPMNAQNIPAHLRDMIVPGDGHELITADMDQVELRAVAGLAGASRLLEVFYRIYQKRMRGEKVNKLDPNEDPYSAVAAAIFTAEFERANDESKDRIRTFAKIFTLASIYGADPIVKWDILRSTEDKEGRLVYLKMTQREVRERHDAWCAANREIPAWWSNVWAEFKQQGYLVEPVSGWRRDFLDDGDEDEVKKEVYNFKAQAMASSMVHKATINIVENLIPFQKWGPGTGLVAQVHDSLTFEVPKGLGKILLPQVVQMMESRAPGMDVVFTASGVLQTSWNQK